MTDSADTPEHPAAAEPQSKGWRSLSTGAWLRLALVFIGAVALVALLLDRPAGPGEGPVNYIIFCRASEKGTVSLDLHDVVDEVVLRGIPSVTEIMVVVSLKEDGSSATYQLEVENPVGGKAVQPIPFDAQGKKSSVTQLHLTGFEVDQAGVFKFRVIRDGKLVAERGLPMSARSAAGTQPFR